MPSKNARPPVLSFAERDRRWANAGGGYEAGRGRFIAIQQLARVTAWLRHSPSGPHRKTAEWKLGGMDSRA